MQQKDIDWLVTVQIRLAYLKIYRKNGTLAKLLNKLRIEMTKSRPRNSNDNALAEGKNAAVVRKTFGYSHIPQWHADKINEFNKSALNPYINYHRPCLYPTTSLIAKEILLQRYDDTL